MPSVADAPRPISHQIRPRPLGCLPFNVHHTPQGGIVLEYRYQGLPCSLPAGTGRIGQATATEAIGCRVLEIMEDYRELERERNAIAAERDKLLEENTTMRGRSDQLERAEKARIVKAKSDKKAG